jgi:hypothetical protein
MGIELGKCQLLLLYLLGGTGFESEDGWYNVP